MDIEVVPDPARGRIFGLLAMQAYVVDTPNMHYFEASTGANKGLMLDRSRRTSMSIQLLLSAMITRPTVFELL